MANYLLFALRGTRYAVAAAAVQTTFWLPELSPVEDLPACFVGMVNLHGQVVPIMDLGLRFGYPPQPYGLRQSVVLLQQDGQRLGLVADEVHDLADIADSALEPYVQLGSDAPDQAPRAIAGTLKWGEAVLILLDVAALLRLGPHAGAEPPGTRESADRFADLDPGERDKLRRRTRLLAQLPERSEAAGNWLALVRIGSGRFAVELDLVCEFAHLADCTPVPCCPPHILGCMNLRGAILTVVDLAPLVLGQPGRDYREVAVLRLGEQRLGLAIHEILDIRAYPTCVAASLGGQAHGRRHCKTLLYDGADAAGLLDLDALLHQGLLEVNGQA